MMGFPGGSDGKEPACNAGDLGSICGSGRSPEEEMATHSSILAWRIPQTEKPGRLHTMQSQRVRYDRVTNSFTFTEQMTEADSTPNKVCALLISM